jgi:hypothetical protein
VVARPIGNFRNSADYHYQTLRCNVDLLKIIQLGITLCDERGNLPESVCTWQFNFKFNLKYVLTLQRSAVPPHTLVRDWVVFASRAGAHQESVRKRPLRDGGAEHEHAITRCL